MGLEQSRWGIEKFKSDNAKSDGNVLHQLSFQL